MCPLKMNWTVCHEFMQENPSTMTPSNITNGFRKCGVYPFDPEAVKPSTTSGALDEGSTDKDSDEDGETHEQPEGELTFTSEEEATSV